MSYKFEEDLKWLSDKVNEDLDFATDVYRALCNMRWRKIDNKKEIYSCSWRYAGGLVADLRGMRGAMDYCEFYCSGNEGHVSDEVEEAFKKLGWEPLPWEYDTDENGRKQVKDDKGTVLLLLTR